MLVFFRALLLVGLVGLPISGALANGISVESAWIRPAPPGVPMAGYMVISNGDRIPRLLVRVNSDAFGMVMMHKSVVTDGVARMDHHDQLEIPARGRVEFKPGDFHLMLMRPVARLALGASATIEFEFKNGERIRVDFPVKLPD